MMTIFGAEIDFLLLYFILTLAGWTFKKPSNQIFKDTRCIMPKCVTRLWGPSLHHLLPGNTAPFKEMSQ